jgi:hypothetical protein
MIQYPNIEAAIAETEGMLKARLFRYLFSETILGLVQEES